MINSTKDTKKGSTNNALGEKNSIIPANYLVVFDKVWQEAEKIFDDMRSTLFKQLTFHSQSIANQEKVIG